MNAQEEVMSVHSEQDQCSETDYCDSDSTDGGNDTDTDFSGDDDYANYDDDDEDESEDDDDYEQSEKIPSNHIRYIFRAICFFIVSINSNVMNLTAFHFIIARYYSNLFKGFRRQNIKAIPCL